MAREKFQDIKFPQWKHDLIEQANIVLLREHRKGLTLTLRGLYYKLLSAKLFPESYRNAEGTINNLRTYKNLGVMINDARLAGLVDWSHIADITRGAAGGGGLGDPVELIEELDKGYYIDRWENQANYVEVWGEKDAVKKVLQRVGYRWNCPFMSCRGSLGQTAMHDRMMEIRDQIVDFDKEVTILYVGDLDPTGWDMSRDLLERGKMFLEPDGVEDHFTLKRVALNIEQAKRFKLEPDPVKLTDGRTNKFVDQFGSNCYELDALDSSVLVELLEEEVKALIDDSAWEESAKDQAEKKKVLRGVAKNWPSISAHIDDLIEQGEYDPDEED